MMRLRDDKDPVRALGFVALHSAYLEDEMVKLTDRLKNIVPMPDNVQAFRMADLARHLRKGLKTLFDKAPDNPMKGDDQLRAESILRDVERIATQRHTLLHSPMIGGPCDTTILKNRRLGLKAVTSREIYDLAEDLNGLTGGIMSLGFILNRLSRS